jgi:hypothetical protein
MWTAVGGVLTQRINMTGIRFGTNDGPEGFLYDYFKTGLDDLTGGGTGVWELRYSAALYVDNNYTPEQILASMPA